MSHESSVGVLSTLSADTLGVFRGSTALELGVSRKRLAALHAAHAIERVFPDTYRMTAVARSNEQILRAALLWGGDGAAAAGCSAAELYGLEGIRARVPEIAVERKRGLRAPGVVVHTYTNRAALMLRRRRRLLVTGAEATLIALGARVDAEAFEIACEDARRRRLTSVPALRAYLARFGGRGIAGVGSMRELLADLDPVHPSRSTLEVKTRRLLVANGFTDFTREYPLSWNGRTYRFDFGFERRRTILETNGRRWHDDANDYEHDNEKWSVPGRHGFRIVLATWHKVTRTPADLLEELAVTLAA